MNSIIRILEGSYSEDLCVTDDELMDATCNFTTREKNKGGNNSDIEWC